mgnify:CR=1 FL=1
MIPGVIPESARATRRGGRSGAGSVRGPGRRLRGRVDAPGGPNAYATGSAGPSRSSVERRSPGAVSRHPGPGCPGPVGTGSRRGIRRRWSSARGDVRPGRCLGSPARARRSTSGVPRPVRSTARPGSPRRSRRRRPPLDDTRRGPTACVLSTTSVVGNVRRKRALPAGKSTLSPSPRASCRGVVPRRRLPGPTARSRAAGRRPRGEGVPRYPRRPRTRRQG